jgi:predicted transposase YdaD
MSKPFDATTRQLIELGPADWLAYLGIRVADPSRVTVIDSDLSTVTAEADRVIRVEDPRPWIEHIELQAGRDVRLEDRMHTYSVLLKSHHRVPVRTSLVLLRPAADGPELTGRFEQWYNDGEIYDWFRSDVVRVWRQPVEAVLGCGLTVLPLAPICDVVPEQVPGVLMAISARLEQAASAEQASTLWNATRILMGLRYEEEQVDAIIEGVTAMLFGIRGIEESSVYQGILRKGEAKGLAEGEARGIRQALLIHGRRKLGPPDEKTSARIAEIRDLDRLRLLLERILDVSSWDELLDPDEASA